MRKLLHHAVGDFWHANAQTSLVAAVQRCRVLPFVLFMLFSIASYAQSTDLSLSKSSSANTAAVGSQVSFTLTVTNQHATVAATNVIVSDPVPPNTMFVSSSGSGSYSNTTGQWTVGTVAAGASASITITLAISGEGVIYNLAEVMSLSQADVDSAPNNGSYLEDDIASACVSVPIWLACDNTAGVTLTAPSGHSNYQWYQDGKPITGATMATYVATIPGSYTYTTSVQPLGCPAGNCCPIIIRKYACLGNLVWNDIDNDGIQDSGEAGVPGVTVTIFNLGPDGIKNGNDVAVNTATTDANGNYVFTNLPPGDYYVMFSNLPNGMIFTTANAGGDDTLDSDADAMGMGAITTLTEGEIDSTHDAGIYVPSASIGDFVWYDTDQDGVQDPGEAGVSGVTVQLFNLGPDNIKSPDDIVVGTTTTVGGYYGFANLAPGSYYVMFSNLPSGYTFSPANVGGDDALDSDVSATGMGAITTLSPGEADMTHDAGIYALPVTYFDLAIVKRLSTGQSPAVSPGDQVSFTIEVRNQGSQPAYNISIAEYVPAGLTFSTALNPSWSLVGGIPTTQLAGPVAPNTSMFVSIVLTVDQAFRGSSLTNTAEISAADNDTNPTNTPPVDVDSSPDANQSNDTFGGDDVVNGSKGDEDDSDIAVINVEVFDLALVKTLKPGQPNLMPGGNVTFNIEIINQGNIAAANIQLADFIPTGLILADPDWTASAGIATYTHVPALAPGASVIVEITFQIDPAFRGGVINNIGEIASATDAFGVPRTDIDSNPNTNNGDDTLGGDNVTDGTNGDEDDSDPAPIVVQLPASLGNFVWYDNNNNGIQDPGEAGVPGVSVLLMSPGADGVKGNADDFQVGSTQITNANGQYLFTNLVPGTYYVQLNTSTLPPNYSITTQNSGGDDNVDSNVNSMGMTALVTLASGESNLTIDAGIAPAAASLGNFVWNDLNGNGIQDAGEPGVPGVTVNLMGLGADGQKGTSDDVVLATQVTNGSGIYNFTNLAIGSYYVMFNLATLPAGFQVVAADQGTNDALDSDANAMGMTPVVTLAAGENNQTIDLGIQSIPCAIIIAQADAFLCEDDFTTVRIVFSENIANYSIVATSGYNNVIVSGNTITFNAYLEGIIDNFQVTLQGANGASCSATDVFTLNRISAPKAFFIVNEPACSNDTVCLKFTGNASPGAILNWNVQDGIIAYSSPATATAPAGAYTCVRFPSAGARMLMLMVDDGGCTDQYTQPVNVKKAPTANAGADQVICSGQTVTLSGTTVGGLNCWWEPAAPLSSTVPNCNTTVTPTATTDYVYWVCDANNCKDSDTVRVTVLNVTPAIAGVSPICIGSCATLTASGGMNYAWSNGSTGSSVSVCPTVTTTYTVTATNALGCSGTATYTVVVNPAATPVIAGPNSLCAGNSVALTASGGTSYVWSTGASTTSISVTPVTTTTYTVTATDSNGCTGTATITITVNPLPIADAGPDQTICLGGCSNLVATGGTIYAWSTGASGASINVCPSLTTTYTVTVTSASGCTSTDQVTVRVNSANANAGPDQVVCAGSAVMLQASGGGSYAWSNGITSAMQVVKPTTTTVYTVTVTSPNGCTGTDQVTVFVNPLPNVQVSGNLTVCPGQCTDLTASGASTYTWFPNDCINQATGATVKACPTGTKTWVVTGVDANGCIDTAHVTISVQGAIADAGPDKSVCPGGPATLTASGGGSYAWSNGASGASINVNPTTTTTYTVTVTTSSGCTSTDQVVVTVLNVPTVDAGADQVICAGASATLTATGGSSYAWSNGSSGASIQVSPVTTTTYTVTATNAAGCTSTDQVTVTIAPSQFGSISPSTTACVGSSTTLTATGGASYAWSTGAVSSSITVAPSVTTTYTVTITSSAGCTNVYNSTVTISAPTANAGPDQTICAGASANLTASATGASSYAWSNGSSAASITVSPSATTTYTVTVTTTSGCTAVDQVVVNVSPLPVASISGGSIFCVGGSTTLTASGGATYLWSNGATSSSINVSSAGTFTVTVTTANGCTDTESITVTPNIAINVTINPGDLAVCPGSGIMLMANATGGSGTYTYSWSPASTLSTASGPMTLASPNATTTYVVTATDANGCTGTRNITITVKPAVAANAGVDQTLCSGASATLTATGGGTYRWSNGATTSTTIVSPTSTSTYTVTVTSADGCSATDEVVVNVGGNIFADASPDQVICAGASTTLTVTGGTSYTWSNGASGSSITVSPSTTTTYFVTATNASGCTATDQVTVTVAPSQFGSVTPSATICSGAFMTLTATGGATYTWSNGASTASIDVTPAATTTYTVTITSSAGCTNTASSTVTVVTPVANAGADQTICAGQSATLTASGGTIYMWSNGTIGSTTTVSPSVTTTYTVTVSPGGGCTATDQVTVTIAPALTVQGSVVNGNCGANNGSITATGGATYAWSNGATGATISNLAPGTYTVTATSASGCTGTASFTITSPAGPSLTLTAGTASCVGTNGTITAGISGGVSPYTLTWSGASSGSTTASSGIVNLNNVVAGTYQVTLADANGCTDVASVNVSSATPVTATASVTPANCCGQNGAVSINAQGQGNLTYAWNNGGTSASATGLAAGTYTITVTSANGCTTVVSAVITPDCSGCQDIVSFDTVRLDQRDTVEVCFPGFTQSQLDFYDILVNGTLYTGAYHGCDYDTLAIYNYSPLSTTGSGPYRLDNWVCNGNTFSAPSLNSVQQLVDSMRVWDPAGNWNLNVTNNNIFGGTQAAGIYGAMRFTNLSNWITATLNPNYGGIANGTNIFIPGTPGKHTVVLVNPTTCCRDTVCVIVAPAAPSCPNFISQTTATAVAPSCTSNASVCLQVPLDVLLTHNVRVNGLPYTAGFQGCNFDTAFAYLYATIPDAGAVGPYTLNSWTVNGTVRTGSFNTISQLVALMNTWDPQGQWTINPGTLTIRGGITSNNYGGLSITQNATGGTATIQANLSLAPRGMTLSLPVGSNIVTYIDRANGCRDSVVVTVTCPTPAPCASFIAQDSIVLPSANCANYFQQFCVEIPFMSLSNYNIKVNGQFYTGTTAACNFNGQGAGTGTSFPVTAGGNYIFEFTNAANGCKDTVRVSAPCFSLTPQYLTATIYEGDVDTICLDITELPGSVFTVENSCPSTGNSVIFDRINGTVCYKCTGVEKGVENVCFVLCDDKGNCDSTFMTVTVLERDQRPAIGVIDLDTTITNTRITLNVLLNDTVPNGLTSFNIVRQPAHGAVTKTADNKLVYTPFNNYCNSGTPDNFEYVVCNPVSCDTVTVFVWVLCDKIRIFTGISPNEDMINDFFVIEGLYNFPNNELRIFNRWGNEVYFKKGYDNSWDGTWNNQPLPDGTYFYIFNDGEGNNYSGYLQIMR